MIAKSSDSSEKSTPCADEAGGNSGETTVQSEGPVFQGEVEGSQETVADPGESVVDEKPPTKRRQPFRKVLLCHLSPDDGYTRDQRRSVWPAHAG